MGELEAVIEDLGKNVHVAGPEFKGMMGREIGRITLNMSHCIPNLKNTPCVEMDCLQQKTPNQDYSGEARVCVV